MIITEQDLNKPEIVFAAICNYHIEVGEDFIDQNESIVAYYPFLTWLLGKGYIDAETTDELMDSVDNIQDLLTGYEEGLFKENGETGNGACYKAYSILAEYISNLSIFKERFFKVLKESDTLTVPDDELTYRKELTDENVDKNCCYFFTDFSYVDAYKYFHGKKISECDW